MISSENIGKRIRMLRKRRGVSQERMAEELGIYQADVSNLERAVGGSGITDLYKLDRIADYFGVSLAELLNGFADGSAAPASEKKRSEEMKMKDCTISQVRYGSGSGAAASEVRLTAPDSTSVFVSFSEYEGRPCFYRTEGGCFEKLIAGRGDPGREAELEGSRFLSGEDYIDIFSNAEPEWLPVCRLLIFIATEDGDSVRELAGEAEGRTVGELRVPVPSREPEEMFSVDVSDLSAVYRYRLLVETSLENPDLFSDVDLTSKWEEAVLKKLKAACPSEEAYGVWKKDLVDAGVREAKANGPLVVCDYAFAGIDEYSQVMPEDEVEGFKAWLDATGSGIFVGCHAADEDEIRAYVSEHIADDLAEQD